MRISVKGRGWSLSFRLPGSLDRALAIVRMDDVEDRHADQLLRPLRAEQASGRWIGELNLAVDVDPDAFLDQVEYAPEPLLGRLALRLAGGERELRAFLLGPVDVEAADPDDVSVLVADRKLDQQRPFVFHVRRHPHFLQDRLAGFDHPPVHLDDRRGIRRIVHVADRLAVVVPRPQVEDALGLAVVEDVVPLGVLHIGHERRILDQRQEPRLDLAQLRLDLHLLRDVARHHQDGRSPAEFDGGGTDVDVDLHPRLEAMAPLADIAQARRPVRRQVQQLRHVLRRSNVGDAHAEELGARVAVVLDRRLIDLEKGQRAQLIDPHRGRVLIEQVAERGIAVEAARGLRTPLLRVPRDPDSLLQRPRTLDAQQSVRNGGEPVIGHEALWRIRSGANSRIYAASPAPPS